MFISCPNEPCPEFAVAKDAEKAPVDAVIYCGACGAECEITEPPETPSPSPSQPQPEPEVTDADPTE